MLSVGSNHAGLRPVQVPSVFDRNHGIGTRNYTAQTKCAVEIALITAEKIATLSEIAELNIGHFLIGEAIFDGLGQTVRKMRAAMDRGRASIAPGSNTAS